MAASECSLLLDREPSEGRPLRAVSGKSTFQSATTNSGRLSTAAYHLFLQEMSADTPRISLDQNLRTHAKSLKICTSGPALPFSTGGGICHLFQPINRQQPGRFPM